MWGISKARILLGAMATGMLALTATGTGAQSDTNRQLDADQQKQVEVAHNVPLIGRSIAASRRSRFEGNCFERDLAIARASRIIAFWRKTPGSLASNEAEMNQMFAKADEALAIEKAATCRSSVEDKKLADDVAALPQLPPLDPADKGYATDIGVDGQPSVDSLMENEDRIYGEILQLLRRDGPCNLQSVQRLMRDYTNAVDRMRRYAEAGQASNARTSSGGTISYQYFAMLESHDWLTSSFRQYRVKCAKAKPAVPPGWEPLLGRWTAVKYGGVIELNLEADGTMSGYIVSTNSYMEEQGYAAGMQILRGYRLGGRVQNVWTTHAKEGEFFNAVQPGRKPGEPHGTASWGKALVIVPVNPVGVLDLPSNLAARLGNYAQWRKVP